MTEYLQSILLVSAVTAVLGLLPTEGRMKRAVSFALAAAVLSALVLPLPKLLLGLPSDYSSLLERLEGEALGEEGYIKAETLSAVEEGMHTYLTERYRLSPEDLTLSLEGDIVDNTVIVRRVTLTLSGRGVMGDVRSMVEHIEKNTNAECVVNYREG